MADAIPRGRRPSPFGLGAWAFILAFYVVPVLYLVAVSFASYSQTKGIDWTLGLQNYTRVLGDSFFYEVLLRTVRVSVATTLMSLIIAFPISHYLVTSRGARQLTVFVVLLMPLVTSVTVMSYGWLILLGRNGVVNAALMALGLTDAPITLMQNEAAIAIGLVHVLIVFMVISISASLQAINPALPLAARSLGAGPVQIFWRITLPLSMPGVRAGALLVFALSMSAYAIPGVLGGQRNKFISTLVYQQSVSLYNWPAGAALAVLLLIATGAILGLSFVLRRTHQIQQGVAP
jgi:putative spermidine/putrescine transport system permease protein